MADKIIAVICFSEICIQGPVLILYCYLFIWNSDVDQCMGQGCNERACKSGLAWQNLEEIWKLTSKFTAASGSAVSWALDV